MITPILQMWKLRLRGKIICRTSHRQGAPYQPPLLLSEAVGRPGGPATMFLSGGGRAVLPMGSPSSDGTEKPALQSPQGPAF